LKDIDIIVIKNVPEADQDRNRKALNDILINYHLLSE